MPLQTLSDPGLSWRQHDVGEGKWQWDSRTKAFMLNADVAIYRQLLLLLLSEESSPSFPSSTSSSFSPFPSSSIFPSTGS